MGRILLIWIVAIAIWIVIQFVINQIATLTKSRHNNMTKEEKREKFEEEIQDFSKRKK